MRKMGKSYLYLLSIYIALEAFRHTGWMLFYEQLLERTRQEINIGFILYSGMIFITAISVPLLLKRRKIVDIRRLRPIFITSVCCALVFRLLQLFTGIIGAYVCLFLWTAAIVTAICICFIHIYRLVPREVLGRFVGAAYFADMLIVCFVELFTGTPAYFWVSILAGIVLCLAVVILYIRHTKSVEPDVVDEYKSKPSRSFVRIVLAVLIIYVLIAGALDNLYFFDEWISLPTLGVYELPMMSAMYPY